MKLRILMKLRIIFRFSALPKNKKKNGKRRRKERGWQIRFNNMMPDKNMPVDFTN
jgi:hypothetical protein